jgi:hypothetical protein
MLVLSLKLRQLSRVEIGDFAQFLKIAIRLSLLIVRFSLKICWNVLVTVDLRILIKINEHGKPGTYPSARFFRRGSIAKGSLQQASQIQEFWFSSLSKWMPAVLMAR